MAGILTITDEPAALVAVGTRGRLFDILAFGFILQNTGDVVLDYRVEVGGTIDIFVPSAGSDPLSGSMDPDDVTQFTWEFQGPSITSPIGAYSMALVFVDDTNGPELPRTIQWSVRPPHRRRFHNRFSY